jgi:hypothetical protein
MGNGVVTPLILNREDYKASDQLQVPATLPVMYTLIFSLLKADEMTTVFSKFKSILNLQQVLLTAYMCVGLIVLSV